ncbi:MAG TPA: PEP/pyruvate-binding domain-containing protein [Dysgonamonadaceae bacterium]|nr:PEP/pyruvate-binding domain-containing protein [Dysgonamonadaceae bacterium]
MYSTHDVNEFRFRDTPFVQLMNKRIYNVLIIASQYDMFILEDDGRVDEQIFNEYTSLSLRYPPRFTQVIDMEEAMFQLKTNRFELVVCMPNVDNNDFFDLAKRIKHKYPLIPVVMLTPFSKTVSKLLEKEDLSGVDYLFSWLGNSDLLLAIIKLVEDKMNADDDVKTVGVQTILLVENSVRFYSSALPILFKYVLSESKEFSKEALNDHSRMMRMRGRPKILLARNYEEAVGLYERYGNNMLGILSDVSFNRNGVKDKLAGIKFVNWVREFDKTLPVVITSAEISNSEEAKKLGAQFVDKNSQTFPQDVIKAVKENFGFGDFIILDPSTQKVLYRIRNLKELQNTILNIPDKALHYHLSLSHFSRFFYSRAMFPVAEMLHKINVEDYKDMNEARQLIHEAIVQYRKMKNMGVVAIFEKERFDKYSYFARIGDGSMGGKGRGLAFMGYIAKKHKELNKYQNFNITIPKTVVLCTDIFDEFMEENKLYPLALSDISDEDILKHFLAAKLPERLIADFLVFFEVVSNPIAIRSSSMLEDSHYQPFAGIFSTYMIPYVEDKLEMTRMLSDAIKAVYASVFYADSKSYMAATQNSAGEEKMAVVLQEVAGSRHNNHFYPTISGVARSINYYPLGDELGKDGVVQMGLGLGKYIVEGNQGLRFCPVYPKKILQLSTVDSALKDTQTRYFALSMNPVKQDFSVDDSFNLVKLGLNDAEADGTLRFISSTYDPNDMIIRDGYYPGGRKIISFVHLLQHNMLPLAEMLDRVLKISRAEMGREVEIEFAVNLKDLQQATFYLLQIRPIVDAKEVMNEDLTLIDPIDSILYSSNVLGHGSINTIKDVVYVKTDGFTASNNTLVAREIEELNKRFAENDDNYVLVGPGRWGSSDPWLGVPVKWAHISQARIICEVSLDKYRIDPSQGSHFFQNLTSLGVGYFTVNPFLEEGGFFNQSFLDEQPALYETEYIRHIRFERPFAIKINGKKKTGVVMKPSLIEK